MNQRSNDAHRFEVGSTESTSSLTSQKSIGI